MAKKPVISDEDKAAFKDAMRSVRRIPQTKRFPDQKTIKIKRIQPKLEEPEDTFFPFSDYDKLPAVQSEDLLSYFRPGIQHKIIRKLRTGQYNVEASLDLHGKTVEQARDALSQFMTQCKRERLRYVLIIHGKGRSNSVPILKNRLNHWLRQTEDVLAFISATAKEGRSGALCVLLRRVKS